MSEERDESARQGSAGDGGRSDDGETDTPLPSDVQRWQRRLLPLMMWMVVGLTLFFFIASFAQLAYLHVTIKNAPTVAVDSLTVPENANSPEQARRFNALAQLEGSLLANRYHQANVFLMSRVWARYLGFVTGMILALVGAAFILGKLREETTELSAEGMGGTLSFRSASPGLVLAVLGVVLMTTTIVTHHQISTAASPVYIQIPFSEKPELSGDGGATLDSAAVPGETEKPPSEFP